jgi:hypothetical protein
MPATEAYSSLLQDFVEPIHIDNETEEVYFMKCQLGQLVWNFCVAIDYKLEILKELATAIDSAYQNTPEIYDTIDFLVERKKYDFRKHSRFIIKIEKCHSNGKSTIRAFTIPAERVNETYPRIKNKK